MSIYLLYRFLKFVALHNNDFYQNCSFVQILPFEEKNDGLLACAYVVCKDGKHSVCLLKLNFQFDEYYDVKCLFSCQKLWGNDLSFAKNDPHLFMHKTHHGRNETVALYRVVEQEGEFEGRCFGVEKSWKNI